MIVTCPSCATRNAPPMHAHPRQPGCRGCSQGWVESSAIDVTEYLHIEFNKALWRSLYGDKPFVPPEKPDFYRQVSQVYGDLSKDGGGELVQLAEEKKLIKDVIVLTFGSRWKIEMAKYLQELS